MERRQTPKPPSNILGAARRPSKPSPSAFSAHDGRLQARSSITRLEKLVTAMPASQASMSTYSFISGKVKSAKTLENHQEKVNNLAKSVLKKLGASAKRMFSHFISAAETVREQVETYKQALREMKAQYGTNPTDDEQDEIEIQTNTLNHIQCMEIPGATDCMTELLNKHLIDNKFTMTDLLELGEELAVYLRLPEQDLSTVPDDEAPYDDSQLEVGDAKVGLRSTKKRNWQEDVEMLDSGNFDTRETRGHKEMSSDTVGKEKEHGHKAKRARRTNAPQGSSFLTPPPTTRGRRTNTRANMNNTNHLPAPSPILSPREMSAQRRKTEPAVPSDSDDSLYDQPSSPSEPRVLLLPWYGDDTTGGIDNGEAGTPPSGTPLLLTDHDDAEASTPPSGTPLLLTDHDDADGSDRFGTESSRDDLDQSVHAENGEYALGATCGDDLSEDADMAGTGWENEG